MSKDVLVDIDIIKGHPKRIDKLIERIIAEIEAVRSEGYELYTLTMQMQQECNKQMENLGNQYRASKFENTYQTNAVDHLSAYNMKNKKLYQDEQESDFYLGNLKNQYDKLDNRINSLNHSKDILDNISKQVVGISKTIDDIKQMSEYWNKIFTITIDGLIDLNNRG